MKWNGYWYLKTSFVQMNINRGKNLKEFQIKTFRNRGTEQRLQDSITNTIDTEMMDY